MRPATSRSTGALAQSLIRLIADNLIYPDDQKTYELSEDQMQTLEAKLDDIGAALRLKDHQR